MKTVRSTLSLNLLKLRDRQVIEIIHDNGETDGVYFSEHDGTSVEPVANLINRLVLPRGGELGHTCDFRGTGNTREQIWVTYYDTELDLSKFDGNHYEFEYTEEGDPEDPDYEWYLVVNNTRYAMEDSK